MAERPTVGQILVSTGRLTQQDCARALAYQKEHGGYFGEALLSLGLVVAEEVEWGLASQFDLPYVYPDADSVDPEAVAMVSPEWALAHLTLPIMKTAEALTVLVESPLNTTAVDELKARTDLRIDLALASPLKIRELIRQVFARGSAAEEAGHPSPVHLTQAFSDALEAAAPRFGISSRGPRSWAWWDDAGTIRRRPLEGLWEQELEQVLSPPASAHVRGTDRAIWEAQVNRSGIVTAVDVRFLGDESGHEYLFRPIQKPFVLRDRFPPPNPGITSEIRLLARSGSARFVVTTNPAELGHDILPHLPPLLLDPAWRSIHIHALDRSAAKESFSLRMPEDPEQWAAEIEALRAFHFDVVTVDLTGNRSDWANTALDVASVAFVLWPWKEDRRPAYDAGIRWELRIVRTPGSNLEWSLDPVHV